MPYDYSDAPPPQFDLIPHGTVATAVLHIRAGGVGEDKMLTRSKKDGSCEYLDCEITLTDTIYKGRKFWEILILEGTTEGHFKSIGINRSTLKAILDSALGLKPDDVSPQARAARTVSLKQFEGITFIAKIGIEKGGAKKDKNGNETGESWADKNILAGVITPDKKDWHPVEQPPPFNGGGSAPQAATPSGSAPPIARPGWA
jgi:hypothetical protein